MCSAAMLRSKAATVQHASELRDVNPELVKMNESVGMPLSGSHGPGAAEVAAQLQDLLENTLRRRCSEQKRLCKTSCQLTIHRASPVAMLELYMGQNGEVVCPDCEGLGPLTETPHVKRLFCREEGS